jgi:hypothetical protein
MKFLLPHMAVPVNAFDKDLASSRLVVLGRLALQSASYSSMPQGNSDEQPW